MYAVTTAKVENPAEEQRSVPGIWGGGISPSHERSNFQSHERLPPSRYVPELLLQLHLRSYLHTPRQPHPT